MFNINLFYFNNESRAQNGELHLGGKDSNVVPGAFVTCNGRMKPNQELYKLDRIVLYFDADSI